MIKKTAALLGGLATAAAFSLPAFALEYTLKSEIRVSARHDDNINLEVDNTDSVYGEELNPSALFKVRSESWSSELDIDLRSSHYNREGYDSDDQYLTWRSQKRGERYSLGLSANATHDTTRTSEGEDSGRYSNSRRKLYSITPTGSYYFNDRQLLTAQLGLSTADYKDERYTGYDYASVFLEWTYIYSQQLRLFLRANGSDYESDGRTQEYIFSGLVGGFIPFSIGVEQTYVTNTESYGGQLGAEYQLTEKLNIYGLVGSSETETDYDIETANDECDNNFWQLRGICDITGQESSTETAEIRANWREERQNFSLGYSIQTQPSSDGYLLEFERVDLGWDYRLTELGKIRLKAIWGENEALDEADDAREINRSNREYLTVRAAYQHRLSEHWYLNASLRYREQEREILVEKANGLGGSIGISYFPRVLQW